MVLRVYGPEQIPSRKCGCGDCVIDYPPGQYGHRPPRSECLGMWQVRWRDTDRRLRSKNLKSLSEAQQFLAQLRTEASDHAA